MADHVRQQVVDSIATVLTGLATTGSRVFKSRLYQLQESELPCLVVTCDGQKVENVTDHFPAMQRREIQIRIESHDKKTANLEQTLNTICKEVEIALANSDIENINLVGSKMYLEVGGDQPIGIDTIIYKVLVETFEDAPDTIL